MLKALKAKTTCMGSVLFRGSLPPRPEEFDHLRSAGIAIHEQQPAPSLHWVRRLDHPEWGSAQLTAFRGDMPSPVPTIEHDATLTDEEREAASAAGSCVALRMEGKRGDVLRDRKYALRFLHAVMGDDGLYAVDHQSQRVWSRAALEDELVHDAALDISQIYTHHLVRDDESSEPTWLHSHGLAEMGFFDYDVLRPSRDLAFYAVDTLRAIAMAIVEGTITETTARFSIAYPSGDVRCVPVKDFSRRAAPADRALRADAEAYHTENRVVLCEPVRGWLGRWSRKVVPSRFLSGSIDGCVCHFSTDATNVMAERARNTYAYFRQLTEELAEFGFVAMVKLGYEVDGGDEEKEHLWFTVHELTEHEIDATLENQPFEIERLSQGDRGRHPVNRLTDWQIMTPMGVVDPRSTAAVRRVRASADKLREALARRRKRKEQA